MEESTGPTHTRYSCCLNHACVKLDSMLKTGDCYQAGGKLVRKCSCCK
jgi:hypothetical protein